eukprot:6666223-Ditylum_brightwellii.AAC.1
MATLETVSACSHKMGYLNIKYLIGHIWEEPLTGNHLLVLLSQAQLVSGSKTPYLKEMPGSILYKGSVMKCSWMSTKKINLAQTLLIT